MGESRRFPETCLGLKTINAYSLYFKFITSFFCVHTFALNSGFFSTKDIVSWEPIKKYVKKYIRSAPEYNIIFGN